MTQALGEIVSSQSEKAKSASRVVSGSAPAYLYAFIEALEAAGAAAGLSPGDAQRLARSTLTDIDKAGCSTMGEKLAASHVEVGTEEARDVGEVAGFGQDEALVLFDAPPEGYNLHIDPLPAALAQVRYVERFHLLSEAAGFGGTSHAHDTE